MAKATCDHCCCCIELEKGCLIIGYLDLIGFIGVITKLFEVWNSVGPTLEMLKELLKSKVTDEQLEDIGKVLRAVIIGVLLMFILLSALKIFFTVILLIGLHKNKRGHVGAYLIYSAIFIFILIIFVITGIVKYATMDYTDLGPLPAELVAMLIGQFITIILSCVIAVYFWMVIRSQYHQMPINRPKRFTNPVDAEGITANRIQPGGPLSDEGSRGANRTHPGEAPQETQSTVRLEGPTTVNDEGKLDTNVADGSIVQSTPVDASTLAADVLPEVPTSQDSDISQSTKADESKLFVPAVTPSKYTRSHSFAATSNSKEIFGDIELVPISKKNDQIDQDFE